MYRQSGRRVDLLFVASDRCNRSRLLRGYNDVADFRGAVAVGQCSLMSVTHHRDESG